MRLFLLTRDLSSQGIATGMALLAYVVCLAPLGCSRALRAAVLDLKRRQSRRAPDPRYAATIGTFARAMLSFLAHGPKRACGDVYFLCVCFACCECRALPSL